jgi:hypothetical protein
MWFMPWVPTVIPDVTSSFTAGSSSDPGVPKRPASTKKSAVRPRESRPGSPISTSEALPSSKLIRTGVGQVARSSSTRW